jgi:uncharacterized protein (TIGR04141 family)
MKNQKRGTSKTRRRKMSEKKKVVKYNIFRILKQRENDLVKELKRKGLYEVKRKRAGGYELIFYFSKVPDKIPIWWTDVYNEFLADIEKPTNKVYFAVFMISGETTCYAISLGKSHFYLKKYCDKDFGLNFAERIADQSNLKIKNSKYFKSRRNRTITAYQEGSEIDYESGESMYYVKTGTINTDHWGKTASFGNSVLLHLDLMPTELTELVEMIENELRNPARFPLPRTEIIKEDAKIKELDEKLAETLAEYNVSTTVQVDEFFVSGVDFIFTDQHDFRFYLKNDSKNKSELGELTISNLFRFIEERDLDIQEKINEIKVYVKNEYGRSFSQPLKNYLDFVYEKERICIIDGKWHKFNQSYIEYLKKEVNKIGWQSDKKYDIGEGVNEYYFNKSKESEGFINCDKVLQKFGERYKIEKMDLYKEGTLYFVKIGPPQKLSYVVDQALNTVRLLQNNESIIEIDGDSKKIDKICLWLILKRRNDISEISDLNSLIFLMKLVEWRRIVVNAGYQPLIKINYKR